MKIQTDIEIPDENIESLIRDAIMMGYIRENERKEWTDKDKKEAIRYAIGEIIKLHIDCKG